NDSWIKRCINLAEVNGDLSVGGIIGLSNGNDEVLHCFNAGTVTAHQNKAGGIIGNSFLGVYESNVNVGAVYCDQLAGGIYAYDTLSQYANCFYDNQMCIKGGCNGNDVHSVIEGYNTLEMVGEGLRNKLGIDNWNFQSDLYPMVTLIEAKDAGKVARTPIFLQNQENVTLVTADFSVATENEVSWSSDDQNVIAVEGDNATLTGTGEAVLTASKNNIYKTIQLTTQFTAIEENAANTIQVYPNPAQNQVNIYGEGIRNIKIINQIGQTVFTTDKSTVDVTLFNDGIYFFEIETNKDVVVQKVIVLH
ncbi:MAG: T9SS type A sorting domain-containing protein, partial [Bacteroidales bacterium]|nr:T9SS type A sorting domain-containing protein [Bacteroidales bacterium]